MWLSVGACAVTVNKHRFHEVFQALRGVFAPAAGFSAAARSVVDADFREQETRGRLGEEEDLLAAEDGVVVIV